MQCREVESVLEQQGLAPLPEAAIEHLAHCSSCSLFLEDLSVIAMTAKQLDAELEPPARLWTSLRAKLVEEGICYEEPDAAGTQEHVSWWESIAAFWSSHKLITAGVGVMLLAAAVYEARIPHGTVTPVANNIVMPATPVQSAENPAQPTVQIPSNGTNPAQVVAAVNTPKTPVQPPAPRTSKEVFAASSVALNSMEHDLQPLRSNLAVEEQLKKNLKTVNEFIAECERHLEKYPNDELAREYLYSAYQQKAELLTALVETGRSEQ